MKSRSTLELQGRRPRVCPASQKIAFKSQGFSCSRTVPFFLVGSLIHLLPTMPPRSRAYSLFSPPSLSMSELVRTTLDCDSTDMMIDEWLKHRSNGHDVYHDWFRDLRERKQTYSPKKQIIAWRKGPFLPENVFCRTVDTGRLIPLDRTWKTHIYHHKSIQERTIPILSVVSTMVSGFNVSYPLIFTTT